MAISSVRRPTNFNGVGSNLHPVSCSFSSVRTRCFSSFFYVQELSSRPDTIDKFMYTCCAPVSLLRNFLLDFLPKPHFTYDSYMTNG